MERTSDEIKDKTLTLSVAQTFDAPKYRATPGCDGIFIQHLQCYQYYWLMDSCPDFIAFNADEGTITLDTQDTSYIGAYLLRVITTLTSRKKSFSRTDEFHIYVVEEVQQELDKEKEKKPLIV